MRALGILIVTGLGGILGKKDVNAPFMLVGAFDFCICFVIIFLVVTGKLKE